MSGTDAPQSLDLRVAALPGIVDARVTGALPGALVTLVYATREGTHRLPGGAVLGVEPEHVIGHANADGLGHAFFSRGFPEGRGAGTVFFAQAMALDPARPAGAPGALTVSPVRRAQVPVDGAPADVYVLFGQSNAEGGAGSDALPASLRGPLPQGRVWNELAGEWQPLTADVNNTTVPAPARCGPELTLVENLTAGGRTVFLVKFAVAETALGATRWLDWSVGQNELYPELLRRIDRASAALRQAGLEPRVRGLCMMQGESDALEPTLAAGYRGLLAELVRQLRSDLASRGVAGPGPVPLVLGLVDQRLAALGFPGVHLVREAQLAVAQELQACATVETSGLALQADRVHFAAEGVMVLGRAMADELGRLEAQR